MRRPCFQHWPLLVGLCVLAGGALALAAQVEPPSVPLDERERSFLEDGPGYLLTESWRDRFLQAGHSERRRLREEFLEQDPLPATAANELREGIERRRRLVRSEGVSPRGVRGRLLFLHGPPVERLTIDCRAVYRPVELWEWRLEGERREVLLFRPGPSLPYELWTPWKTKAALYTEEMRYFLRQWEELKSRIVGTRRFDLQLCDQARRVDRVTGISGLDQSRQEVTDASQMQEWLAPPEDLAAWAGRAARTKVSEAPPELPVQDFQILFPGRDGQRIVTRIQITLPADAPLEPWKEERKEPELRLAGDVLLEEGDEYFEEFRVRFHLERPPPGEPLALVLERPLRPERDFVLRLRLSDEVGEAETWVTRSFRVPARVSPGDRAKVIEDARAAVESELSRTESAGAGILRLVPASPNQVMLGFWRAEAIVSGTQIVEVAFFVDGERQLTRTRPPFTAELRLAELPRLQAIRAEGFDGEGNLVAADEVVLNQPQGTFRVEIVQPGRDESVSGDNGSVQLRARIVVPAERSIERVEFRVNDAVAATRTNPPWEAELAVPAGGALTVLSAVAFLDDGSRREDVRILNAARFGEEVEVELVELFATVTDRSGRPVHGLGRGAFTVFEEGEQQSIARFEEVEDLPLHLGVVLDVSGSMAEGMAAAERAATGFLESILTPRDSAFAITFADSVELVMPPTDDPVALAEALTELQPAGWTHLYDAVVSGVYHLRDVRGRRALVVLTDGEDNASQFDYQPMLTYARRSGVMVYTIGIASPTQSVDRRKLNRLAEETGGRFFLISAAEELHGVYEEIERELRSQYLLAYAPEDAGAGGFREVSVEVEGRDLSVRTARGVYR